MSTPLIPTSSRIEQLNSVWSELELTDLLHQIASKYGNKAAFSLGFGREGMIIADQIFRHQLPIRVFTIDTGRLFHETQELHQRVITKYRQKIEVFTPQQESVENLMSNKGPLSFYDSLDNRLECCNIRKVSPLRRALQEADLWITGLRQGQSTYRQQFELAEWNEKHQVIKVNPLIKWSTQAVDAYLAHHKVPVNSLHRKGFTSVGCAPCTRAIQPGEDERAGRWWWENSHKECGLHV